MDELLLAAVRLDRPDELLGTLTLVDGRIVTDTDIATETVDMLRRRSRLADLDLFERLRSDGWSNGQIRIGTTL